MIEIVNLFDNMKYLNTVSSWIWNEWEKDLSILYVEYTTKHSSQKNDIPQTFVALLDGKPVGTVALWRNDLRCRQDLYPWMACLYVQEEHRKRGIGTILQDFAIEQAKKLGYKSLYLFTDLNGYYEKNGWTYLEDAPTMKGKTVKIYKYSV